jgi:hypothetical protein
VNEHHLSFNNTGKLATFVVHVQCHQNATWQGQIVWAEKNQTSSFRSALEMIKLMDSAVEQAGVDNDNLHFQETGGE